jgi:hypothetical protein
MRSGSRFSEKLCSIHHSTLSITVANPSLRALTYSILFECRTGGAAGDYQPCEKAFRPQLILDNSNLYVTIFFAWRSKNILLRTGDLRLASGSIG